MNDEITKTDREIESITVMYKDGTNEEITKGCVVSLSRLEKDENISFNMVDIKGGDIELIIKSVILLGEKLGMFEN